MPSFDQALTIDRPILPIFYVLDTSGSMRGSTAAALNSAMEKTMAALKSLAKTHSNAQLKIGVLEFSSGARWQQENGLENAEDFRWKGLKTVGITDMGAALDALNDALSKLADSDPYADSFSLSSSS